MQSSVSPAVMFSGLLFCVVPPPPPKETKINLASGQDISKSLSYLLASRQGFTLALAAHEGEPTAFCLLPTLPQLFANLQIYPNKREHLERNVGKDLPPSQSSQID